MGGRQPSDLAVSDRRVDWVNLHVCRRLKAKRILCNMSQERLATALGISYQQLQRYEAGKGRLTCSLLYRAAVALEVPIAYFFETIPYGEGEALNMDVEKTALLIGRTVQDIPSAKIQRSLLELIGALARSADGSDTGGER